MYNGYLRARVSPRYTSGLKSDPSVEQHQVLQRTFQNIEYKRVKGPFVDALALESGVDALILLNERDLYLMRS